MTIAPGSYKVLLLRFVVLVVCALAAPVASYATTDTLRLNGSNDHLRVANDPALNPGGAITIEAWIRPTITSNCHTVVGKDFSTAYWLGICAGKIRFYTSGSGTSIDSSNTVPVGEWTHIAVTFDGNRRNYYIDGVLDLTQVTPAPIPVNIFDLGIGGQAQATPFGFFGDIAEVRIWDVVRSQAEIRSSLVAQLEPPIEGLVAVWHLQGGEGDAAGLFSTSIVDGANFSGTTAPPVPYDPIRIPRMLAPILDGYCEGLYNALRVPIYRDDDPSFNPGWAYLGATGPSLYVCIEQIPYGLSLSPFASVYIDPDATGGFFAETDDFRAQISPSGTPGSEFGDGAGGFSTPGPSLISAADDTTSSEFYWSAEYKLNRNLLASTSNRVFGLELIHHWHNFTGDDHGWPVDFFWNRPDTWEAAMIDDTLIPPADSENPTSFIRSPSSPGFPQEGDTIQFFGQATDDNAVESITIFIDFTAVRICDITPPSPSATCFFSTASLTLGSHFYHAVATDTAGREQSSEFKTLRVFTESEAPQVTLSHTPEAPATGTIVDLQATATDPSGISSVTLRTDAEPANFTCNFSGAPTSATCTLHVRLEPDRNVLRYTAMAVDTSRLTTLPHRRIVLIGNSGPDSDGDGLSNAVEAELCTSSTNIDTDRDGLKDSWEILGLTFTDGRSVPLPELGANPCWKDVFLQYDYETGARVRTGVVQNVVSAFRRHDINLHVTENERPRLGSAGVSGIKSTTAVYQKDVAGNFWFDPRLMWTHYYAYGRHKLGVSGSWPPVFTYDIYRGGAGCECPPGTADPSLCGLGGASDPSIGGCVRESILGQSIRFMHELGHNIGLGHGGRKNTSLTPVLDGEYMYYPGNWDSDNYKPNYISLMNYGQNGSVCLVPGPARNFVTDLTYSEEWLADLNETSLDERTGSVFATLLALKPCPVATAGAVPVTIFTCNDPDESNTLDIDLSPPARRTAMLSNGTQPLFRMMHGGRWGNTGWSAQSNGIDFDCDGSIENSVVSNINGTNGERINRAHPSGGRLPKANEICGDGVDNDRDGFIDETCFPWNADRTLFGYRDWPVIPSPPECKILYSEGDSCYPWTDEYRSAIPDNLPDCRPSGNPDVICPSSPTLTDGSGLGPPVPAVEGDFAPVPPGLEACNNVDDDGDGEIDEGCRDTDSDGIADAIDTCPQTPNTDQADSDRDHLGDVCEVPSPVSQLTFSVDAKGAVDLTWKHPEKDIIGFNVYRETTGSPTPMFLGGNVFPSTQTRALRDPATGESGNHTYTVYPVNLVGVEGLGVSITIEGDFDGDSIVDNNDNCPLKGNPDQSDDDNDGAGNVCDNCIDSANGPALPDKGGFSQLDVDGDGYGNICDPDFDNNGRIDFSDLARMKSLFFGGGQLTDLDGDGKTAFSDLAILKSKFFGQPGPSGLAP